MRSLLYELGDGPKEWVVADSEKAAVDFHQKFFELDDDDKPDSVRLVPEDEIDKLELHCEETGKVESMRASMDRRLSDGEKPPFLVASTEL